MISAEHLAALSPPRQVEDVVASLAPRDVHVVYATRGLARLLPSEWQEHVKNGSTTDFGSWAERVLTERRRGPGRWVWRVHDPAGVVRRWSSAVPLDRIHVLTVPPLPADPRELWDRFASVLGVDPGLATGVDVHVNRSLGCAETELLRRVNSRLPESFPRWNYLLLARRLLASDILSGPGASAPPTLPAHLEPILRERQERIIAGILASGCDLVGSPDDLRPGSARGGSPVPTDAELVEAAVRGLTGLLVEMGRRQDLARSRPTTRVVESLLRQDHVITAIAAAAGRSALVDGVVARGVRLARRRVVGR